MNKMMITFVTLTVLASELHAAPQFITIKDGKLGVNFGGYHAGIGIGGGQGLFAEAGTPQGQHASAGLGGIMGGGYGNSGGLFAGATAGNGIHAAAGLGGSTNPQNSAGGGYAGAQFGNRIAIAGLGGENSEKGSSGVKFSGTNVGSPTVIRETVTTVPVKSNVENEIDGFENVLPLNAANADGNIGIRSNVDIPAVEKEVRPVDAVVEKVYHEEQPSHNVHKSVAFLGVNAGQDSDAHVAATENVGIGGHLTVNKEIVVHKNPNLFADIFNVPITALTAVNKLLGTIADNTKVSVKKTASVSHESDIGLRNAYATPEATEASGGHQISIESQQSGSDIFQNIFNIPIHTLEAVSKLVENNAARKRIQISQSGDHNIEASAAAGLHLGPHARRRAAKRLILVDTSKALTESH